MSGADLLSRYQSELSTKYFCSRCGTPLYNTTDSYPAIRLVYLGSVENNQSLKPRMNVWCENQLAWVNAIAELKNYPQNSD